MSATATGWKWGELVVEDERLIRTQARHHAARYSTDRLRLEADDLAQEARLEILSNDRAGRTPRDPHERTLYNQRVIARVMRDRAMRWRLALKVPAGRAYAHFFDDEGHVSPAALPGRTETAEGVPTLRATTRLPAELVDLPSIRRVVARLAVQHRKRVAGQRLLEGDVREEDADAAFLLAEARRELGIPERAKPDERLAALREEVASAGLDLSAPEVRARVVHLAARHGLQPGARALLGWVPASTHGAAHADDLVTVLLEDFAART